VRDPCSSVSMNSHVGIEIDLVAAAFDIAVVLCYTETRDPSSHLLASASTARLASTLAGSRKTSANSTERLTYKSCSLSTMTLREKAVTCSALSSLISSVPTEWARWHSSKACAGNAASTSPCQLACVSGWPSSPSATRRRPRTHGYCDQGSFCLPSFPPP
jgi:hypothetical protein